MGRKHLASMALAALVFGNVAAEATPIRPGVAAGVQTIQPALTGKIRAARSVGKQESLLGAPLLLVFLGAAAITIGTIIITNNDNGSSR